MRLLVLAGLAFAASGSAAPPPAAKEPNADTAVLPLPPADLPGSSRCHKGIIHADTPRTELQARPLTELPDGDTLLAVYREKDGCPDPVIVRYGNGRAPSVTMPAPERAQPRLYR